MNKIVIVGRGGSGKNHLASIMGHKGFQLQVSCTTRPMRPGEVHEKDYYFMPEVVFDSLVKRGKMKEWKEFNGWKYGTLHSEWESKNLFIYTPSGIRTMNPQDREQCLIIFLDIPRNIIVQRLKERNDNSDSLERRLRSDDKDFAGFKDYDIRITNPNF